MTNPSKKLGVIVGVDGSVSQVGMYSMSNDSQLLWYGDILTGPKIGAFLTIKQNDVKIIATVSSEKVVDQQNTVRSIEFDNRFHKDSINRVIVLKTKGVIEESEFQITSQYVPMVGNEVTLTTKEELDLIFGLEPGEDSIYIGKSLLEGQPINIPINKFFASHIGIFGNTGSGKSNTLHKVYLELFKSQYRTSILRGSQFFVIDFNGEYIGEETFGLDVTNKQIFEVDTRSAEAGQKMPIKKSYLFDPDILAILFDARPATQVPFLRKSINTWNESNFNGESIAKFVIGTIKKILRSGDAASPDAKDNWISVAKQYITDDTLLEPLSSLGYISKTDAYTYELAGSQYINKKEALKDDAIEFLRINDIMSNIAETFNNADEISKLKMHLSFQKVHQSAWKSTNIEHLNPLFNRIDSAFASLSRVIDVVEDISDRFKPMNIISLVHANQEITRLMPMLLSKMIYDEQKSNVAGKEVGQTKHLIIDEAHNILNTEFRNNGDDWQDYRLSIFEEIIKEGRKFGFYLTLSSQRPADISSTIMSQVHNYLIHRLVNEKDLQMLENTMPTLDKNSYKIIPSLGKGEVIITGNAMQVPVFVQVDKEKKNRPKSDDILLTRLWKKQR
ncbi:ATP-binding protein [Leuconostoc pseudomesenteroides]|uniref:ATP-binding protein n=1 Tax=Leuconostoc pseudomesenteroides TaxID=33968 RepID=UPI004035F6FA